MNTEETTKELIQNLQSENPQAQAAALDTIVESSFSADSAQKLFPYVLATLDCKNAWVRMKAPKALAALAETHAVSLGSKIDNHLPNLIEILDYGQKEFRGPVARLVGATATEDIVRELNNRLEYELDSVKQGIEAGLQNAIDVGIAHLEQTNVDIEINDSIAQALVYLARTHPRWVVEHEKRLSDLLDGANGDIAGEVFVTLLRTDVRTELSTEILTEAVDIDSDVQDDRFAAAVNSLEVMVRSDTEHEAVREATDRYLDWLSVDDHETKRRSLELLRQVAKHEPSWIADQIDDITATASDSEKTITASVRKLMKTYASALSETPEEYLITLLSSTGGRPGFTWLADTLDVLRYETGGDWGDIEIGRLGDSLVTGIHRAAENRRTVPVFWPAFEPAVTVVIATAVLLDGVSDGTDTVLYTKGTSTQWGGKKEVRNEYARYGVEIPRDIRTNGDPPVMPLDELLPHGYVYDGQLKINGEITGPANLLLVSNGTQLEAVNNRGPTLFNFHSRVTDEEESFVDAIIETNANRLICPVYSLYTKHDYDGNRVPNYGPPNLPRADVLPDVRAVQDAFTAAPSKQDGEPSTPLSDDSTFRTLASGRDVRLEKVDAEPIRNHLTEGYAAWMDLIEFDAERAGWRSFSYLQRFERLPVPVDRYDEWVLDKRRRGRRGHRSWTMREFVDEFDRFVHDVDMLARAGTSDVHEQLQGLLSKMRRQNPLYDELSDRIADAVAERRQIAIYTSTPSWRRTLRGCLLKDGVVYESAFRSGAIQIVDRDTVRDMDPCDELIIAGPQRQQHIGFHISPAADETTVLTYEGRWRRMINRRLRQFIDQVNATLQVADSTPIPYPDVSVVRDHTIADSSERRDEQYEFADSEGLSQPRSQTSDAEAVDLQDRFAESLDVAPFERKYAHDKMRYDEYSQRAFDIETVGGESLYREAGSRLLVEERRAECHGVETTYRWISPAELPIGSTIIVIEDEVWVRLWDEWLDNQYEDVEGNGVTNQLRIWYETLKSVMDEIQRMHEANNPVGPEVLDYIVIEAQAAGVERGKHSIENWFRSVHAADNPIDLARNSALTMGPGDGKDIQRIGEAFDRDSLTGEDGARIDYGLRKIRGAHIHEGREIRADVATRLTEHGADAEYIFEHATRYEVTAVTEHTKEDERDGRTASKETSGQDISPRNEINTRQQETIRNFDEETIRRLTQLVELAPTKNSELAEAWGYDSGSEVYHYLSSNLRDFYTRNDDKLIVPTEAGESAVEGIEERE